MPDGRGPDQENVGLRRSSKESPYERLGRSRAMVQGQHHQLSPVEAPGGLYGLAIRFSPSCEARGTHKVAETVSYHQVTMRGDH